MTDPQLVARALVGDALVRVKLLRNRGHVREALALAERHALSWPRQLALKALRADLLVRVRRFDEARALLAEVFAENPAHQSALIALGDLSSVTGRLEAADGAYRAAAQAPGVLGDAPHLVRRHARVLSRLGRADEALAMLDRGIAARLERGDAGDTTSSGSAELQVARGWLLLRAGRLAAAGEAADALAQRLPDDARVRRLMYEARTRRCSPTEAGREVDLALSTTAGRADPELWVVRARRASEAGEWARAAESWLAAFALDPARTAARRHAGFAFKRAGELERAASCLEPEFLADPGDVFVRGCLLNCLAVMERRKHALDLLRRALIASPHVKALYGIRRKLARQMEAGT